MNNNQSKKSECIGVMIICGLCEKPFCNGCFKGCPDCHSSQDLEGECKLCLKLKGACPLCTRKGASITLEPKPVSEKKCEEKGYHTGYHSSQEPVSEGKECKCDDIGETNIRQENNPHFHLCPMYKKEETIPTPPSNALRSEEELRKEWLEVGQMEFKMFAGYASMVADWWIAKLTSERQRAYFEGVQNGINECKPEFDLARADERKKMGEILEREIEIWFLRLHNEPERWTVKQAMDYISALLNKHQDK